MEKKSVLYGVIGITAMFLVAGIIVFVVFYENKSKNNKDTSVLNTINTPFNFGTSIYDVMNSGNRQ